MKSFVPSTGTAIAGVYVKRRDSQQRLDMSWKGGTARAPPEEVWDDQPGGSVSPRNGAKLLDDVLPFV
jgi:hypothetical protein